MKTTAIYQNRIEDKRKIEEKYGLHEFGNPHQEFYTLRGNLFAVGYTRIVYGDHGPYIEFEKENIIIDLKRKFNKPPEPKHYYEWFVPTDGSRLKVYYQLRDVKNLPFAPKGGHREYREEGYADYIPGKIYVNPYDLLIPDQQSSQEGGMA